MPFYQFLAPAGSPTLAHRAELAAAFTATHCRVTGAPATYVHCAFVEIDARNSVFVAGEAVDKARLVGIIRPGRPVELKKKLIVELGSAWARVTGESIEGLAIWLEEVPGYQTLENGFTLPEAADDIFLVAN